MKIHIIDKVRINDQKMFPDIKLFALNIEMLRLSFESYRSENHHLKPPSITTIKSCKEGILKELIQTLQ